MISLYNIHIACVINLAEDKFWYVTLMKEKMMSFFHIYRNPVLVITLLTNFTLYT